MPPTTSSSSNAGHPKRADARCNEQALLNAAAKIFVSSGVDAPVRQIAAAAGMGTGTIYRHFPTRADLIVAVYRHQVEACAQAGPTLLAEAASPREALIQWTELFVDFLTTKHGLAAALQGDKPGFDSLHSYFLERLIPACETLLDAALRAGEITVTITAYEFLRSVGNLCIASGKDPDYNPRRVVHILINGLSVPLHSLNSSAKRGVN